MMKMKDLSLGFNFTQVHEWELEVPICVGECFGCMCK